MKKDDQKSLRKTNANGEALKPIDSKEILQTNTNSNSNTNINVIFIQIQIIKMLKQANAVDEAVNPLTQGKHLKLKQIQI